MRLARRLYEARKELCENLNLRAIIARGRIPNYIKYADQLTPRQYIEKVRMREIFDPTLTFQLANDFHVKRVLRGYMSGDLESKEYATLLEWSNIYYQKDEAAKTPKSVIRIGLVQWQMRPFDSLESLYDQIEFFVDAVSDYKSDFILFPELFNAPLMAGYNHLGEAAAIRQLAGYSQQLADRFSEFAMNYNINIITGSMPYLEDEKLYNTGWLCRRDGTREEYRKLHITPAEESAWGIHGGDSLRVFDTDAGKIGVLICYDVEFPELGRLLASQGLQILFVPFMTDTQNGYMRVRRCSQARAIENECYVAIAGSVGNLPDVNNMDIQYGQSAVFTPADFAFPTNGIKTEATPNTEMTLIADVDLDLLKELHSHGSVRNLLDRRLDLYQVMPKSNLQS
jgi:predicted amidohydrolase